MIDLRSLFAGFGGQGVLFGGKVLANLGLIEKKEVSWLPSYGPEMRGGTANCSVCISDKKVGSPLVIKPEHLIVMNIPSFEKFEGVVAAGGTIYYDSSLIDSKHQRDDISYISIPSTGIAREHGFPKLANIVLMGRFLKEIGYTNQEKIEEAIKISVSGRKQELIEVNLRAYKLGYDYQEV